MATARLSCARLARARFFRTLHGVAVGLAVLAGSSVGTSAGAAPITYDYAGSFTAGPLLGQAFSGWFSFDDSLAQPGAIHIGIGVVGDLSFTFEGVTYDETDAPLAALAFNASGILSQFLFGTDCTAPEPGQLNCSAGPSMPGSWYVQHSVVGYTELGALPDDPELSSAVGQPWSRRANAVPEPGSLALTGAALLPLFGRAALRRRLRFPAPGMAGG